MAIEKGGVYVVLAVLYCGLLVLLLALMRLDRASHLRQRLSDLLYEAIEYAYENHVSVQDPAHAMLQRSINSMMRFSHDMGFTRFLLLWATRTSQSPGMIKEYDRQWQDALDQLPAAKHRERIAGIRERALLEVSKHLALGSLPWILALSKAASLNRLWPRYRSSLLRRARILEIDAVMRSDRPRWSAGI